MIVKRGGLKGISLNFVKVWTAQEGPVQEGPAQEGFVQEGPVQVGSIRNSGLKFLL